MFKIVPDPEFSCPVFLSRPASETPVKVTFTFRHKGLRELAAWMGKASKTKNDADFLDEVIAGWGPEILGPDDQPLPYSKKALAQLLERFPASGVEILRDYTKRLKDARQGN